MSERRLSLRNLVHQRMEIEKDLTAFRMAYDVICRRLKEAQLTTDLPSLERWSGTSAVTGSLELSITYLEKELADYIKAIVLVESGEIENVDNDLHKPPILRLVPKDL